MEILQILFHLMYTNRLLKSPQTLLVTRSLVHCGMTCVTTPDCYSFFYNLRDGNCYIVDGYVFPDGPATQNKKGVVYYSKPSPEMLCKFLLNYRLDATVRMCYKVHDDSLDFQPAQERCQTEGANLASLKTTSAKNFFINKLNIEGVDMFFGATDAGTPGAWRWMDGSSWPSFTASSPYKHCLEYYHGGYFDLEYCSGHAQRFVCEIPLPIMYY